MGEAKVYRIGPSRDHRTNRWMCICECGKSFEPLTTMLRQQQVDCPKCGAKYITDYNAEPNATIKKLK